MNFNFILDKYNFGIFVVLAGLLILICILFILQLSNSRKIKKLTKKYKSFMFDSSAQNIEEMIQGFMNKVNDVHNKNRDIELKINSIERDQLNCIQKIGVVRFNAFENVGSDLSYSIALLDKNDDGVILSGIFSRDSSTTYAKPIIAGNSKYPLSAEEIQAIDIAKKSTR